MAFDVPSSAVTTLVMLRNSSSAPTVTTSFAVPGELMESALPFWPLASPAPSLPAANTNNTGCGPVTSGNASRTAAS